MKDQYKNEMPDDLVSMPSIEFLSDNEIKTVVNANWYDAYDGEDCGFSSWLCVSAKAIDYLSEDAIEDYIDRPIKEILLVNDILKRWSIEDGFYHA